MNKPKLLSKKTRSELIKAGMAKRKERLEAAQFNGFDVAAAANGNTTLKQAVKDARLPVKRRRRRPSKPDATDVSLSPQKASKASSSELQRELDVLEVVLANVSRTMVALESRLAPVLSERAAKDSLVETKIDFGKDVVPLTPLGISLRNTRYSAVGISMHLENLMGALGI